jgi:hypothetical protein
MENYTYAAEQMSERDSLIKKVAALECRLNNSELLGLVEDISNCCSAQDLCNILCCLDDYQRDQMLLILKRLVEMIEVSPDEIAEAYAEASLSNDSDKEAPGYNYATLSETAGCMNKKRKMRYK